MSQGEAAEVGDLPRRTARPEVAMRRWVFGFPTTVLAAGLMACGGGDSPTGASGGAPVFSLSVTATPAGAAGASSRAGSGGALGLLLMAELAETGGRAGGTVASTTVSAQLLDGSRRGLSQSTRDLLAQSFFPEGTTVGPGQRLVREGVVDAQAPLIFDGGEQAVVAEIDRLLVEITMRGDDGAEARVPAEASFPCSPTDTALCLQNGRFRGLVEWTDFDGGTGIGRAEPETEETGYFWFFNPSRPEHTLEVLDRCADNGRFWVRATSVTPFETTLRVTDTRTGHTLEFRSALGASDDDFNEESAFATCP